MTLSSKISFGFWRRTASTFHLTIIIYSMSILIGIYVYQVRPSTREGRFEPIDMLAI